MTSQMKSVSLHFHLVQIFHKQRCHWMRCLHWYRANSQTAGGRMCVASLYRWVRCSSISRWGCRSDAGRRDFISVSDVVELSPPPSRLRCLLLLFGFLPHYSAVIKPSAYCLVLPIIQLAKCYKRILMVEIIRVKWLSTLAKWICNSRWTE